MAYDSDRDVIGSVGWKIAVQKQVGVRVGELAGFGGLLEATMEVWYMLPILFRCFLIVFPFFLFSFLLHVWRIQKVS